MTAIALKLTEVHKSFGSSEIINGVNLEIPSGERHAIIGPNGAGKSTLFNLISGFYPLSSGKIELNGHDITNRPSHQINRSGLSRSFQVTNIFPKMSVFENIRCALLWPMGYRYSFWHLCGRLKTVNKKAEELLEKINMAVHRDKPPRSATPLSSLGPFDNTLSEGPGGAVTEKSFVGSKNRATDLHERHHQQAIRICVTSTLLALRS